MTGFISGTPSRSIGEVHSGGGQPTATSMKGKFQAGVHKHNMHHAHKHAASHMAKRMGNLAKSLKSRRPTKSGKSSRAKRSSSSGRASSANTPIGGLARFMGGGGSGGGSGSGGQNQKRNEMLTGLVNTNTKLTPDKMASFVDELATLLDKNQKKAGGEKDEEAEAMNAEKFRDALKKILKSTAKDGEKFGHKDYNDVFNYLTKALTENKATTEGADQWLEIIDEARNQNDSEFIEKLGRTSEAALDRVALDKDTVNLSTGLLDHTSKNLDQSEKIWGNTLQTFFDLIDDLIEHDDDLSPGEIIGEIKNLYMKLIADSGQRVNTLYTIDEGEENDDAEISVSAKTAQVLSQQEERDMLASESILQEVQNDYATQQKIHEAIADGKEPPPTPPRFIT